MNRNTTHTRAVESDTENLRENASLLAEDMQRVGNSLKTLAQDSWENVQDKLANLYEEGKGRYSAAESGLEKKVRSDPLKAVLIAAGVGFVLGWLKK